MESNFTVRNAGLVTLAGATVGVIASIDRVTEAILPNPVAEIVIAAAFVALFFGVAGLARSGAAGDGTEAKIGFVITALGLALATFYEATLIFRPEPSEAPGILAGLLIGAGMLMAGMAVLRRQRWSGWRRTTPLLIGLCPLLMVFTYPLLESSSSLTGGAGQNLDQALTAMWFLCWGILGFALWSAPGQEHPAENSLAG